MHACSVENVQIIQSRYKHRASMKERKTAILFIMIYYLYYEANTMKDLMYHFSLHNKYYIVFTLGPMMRFLFCVLTFILKKYRMSIVDT